MSSFLAGDVMRLKVEGKEIFHEVEVSLDAQTDFKEIATKDTDGTEFTPGAQSFSMSVSAKASDDATTQNDAVLMTGYWEAKTKVAFEIANGVTGNIKFSGEAYVENFNMGSTNEEIVDFSYSLKGTGKLIIGVIEE